MKSADFPLPDTEWEGTRGFWEAAAREELAIPRCAACGRYQWYPHARCRACGGGVELLRPFGQCSCGCSDLEWLSGDELRIKSLEVD